MTKVHREPDELLLLLCIYALGLGLRLVSSVYGLHFASVHTDRTPKNYKEYFKLLHVVGFVTLLSSAIVHKFLTYHIDMFTTRYGE